jgi:hypothetical protein
MSAISVVGSAPAYIPPVSQTTSAPPPKSTDSDGDHDGSKASAPATGSRLDVTA